jgi:hypothetical protein
VEKSLRAYLKSLPRILVDGLRKTMQTSVWTIGITDEIRIGHFQYKLGALLAEATMSIVSCLETNVPVH